VPERFPPQHWMKRAKDVRASAASMSDRRRATSSFTSPIGNDEIERLAERRRPVSQGALVGACGGMFRSRIRATRASTVRPRSSPGTATREVRKRLRSSALSDIHAFIRGPVIPLLPDRFLRDQPPMWSSPMWRLDNVTFSMRLV
jgi:hypothetical protein